MSDELQAALRLLDRVYARYGTGEFPVERGGVSWQDASGLGAHGWAVLNAHPDFRRPDSISFRAVPVLDSPAPYRFVPVLPAHVGASWTGSLTKDGLRLVAPTGTPGPPRRVPLEVTREPLTLSGAAIGVQGSLDGGAWAPEQTQIAELLPVAVETPAAVPLPMPRTSLFGGVPTPYERLAAPVLTGAQLPGWATLDGQNLGPATWAAGHYDTVCPQGAGWSASPTAVTFFIPERRTVAEVVDDLDLPVHRAWKFAPNPGAEGPTARLASRYTAWDLYVVVDGRMLSCADRAAAAPE